MWRKRKRKKEIEHLKMLNKWKIRSGEMGKEKDKKCQMT